MLAVVLMGTAPGPLVAQQSPRPLKPSYDDGNVEVLAVQGTVHLVAGSGANLAVQVDPDGMLVVDSSAAAVSENVLAAIKTISDKPIRHIVNTSADEHHTGGNEACRTPAGTSARERAARADASRPGSRAPRSSLTSWRCIA